MARQTKSRSVESILHVHANTEGHTFVLWKALEIQQTFIPLDHPDLATPCINLLYTGLRALRQNERRKIKNHFLLRSVHVYYR